MRSKKMKRLYFIITFVFIMLLTACSNKADTELDVSSNTQSEIVQKSIQNSDESEEVSLLSEDADLAVEESQEQSAQSQEQEDTIEPSATKEISIYTINDATAEVEVVPALIPEDSVITPELIVEMVTDSLADQLVEVGIDGVTTKDDTVIVSFLSNQPPVTNVGSGIETAILDAFAQSLVENLPDYPKVIFQMEGKAYSSGHYAFLIDEVYLDGSKTN